MDEENRQLAERTLELMNESLAESVLYTVAVYRSVLNPGNNENRYRLPERQVGQNEHVYVRAVAAATARNMAETYSPENIRRMALMSTIAGMCFIFVQPLFASLLTDPVDIFSRMWRWWWS